MSETRSREPLERDKYGARILTHGEGGYKRGCGCQVCMDGHAEAERDRRAARTEARQQAAADARAAAGLPPEEGALNVTARSYLSREGAEALSRHLAETRQSEAGFLRGLIYDAISFERARRDTRPPVREHAVATRAPGKAWVDITAHLSAEGSAALAAHLAVIGQTEAGFIRGLVYDAIGFEDMRRRDGRSNPRPNRNRQQAGNHTEGWQ